MVSNNRHWKNQHRKREGGENPPTSSPLSIQAHSIIGMAFRRGISHRRPSVCTIMKLMCLIFVTTCHHRYRCLAFSSNTAIRSLNGDRKILVNSLIRPLQNKHINPIDRQLVLSGQVTDEVEIRSRPNIFVIKTHEDYVKFLEEDDRLCVIKFYAEWCKSCQKFGVKFRQLASDEGESNNVRFAQIEYTANAKLCKTLKVNKLPTVHMYRKGSGKIVDMTCKPSLFHLVVEELHRVLGGAEKIDRSESNDNDVFDVAMVAGSALGEEIVASLKKEGEVDGGTKKNNWFRLSL